MSALCWALWATLKWKRLFGSLPYSHLQMIGCHTINNINGKSWNSNPDVSAIGLITFPLNNWDDPAIFTVLTLLILQYSRFS
jgi:hypothetical protein